MRIGIDCRLWSQTGVGRYTRNLVGELAKIDKKNEYVLFVRKEDLNDVSSAIDDGLSGRCKLVIADARWHSVAEQTSFLSVLNQQNCDLVHFPYFSHPIFYNKPFIVTIHDLIINHYPTGKASTLPLPFYLTKRVMYNRVLSHAVKKSKKIIVPLNAVKADVEKTLGVSSEKIAVTLEGAFNNSELRIQNSELQFKIENYFLYVGNAYPHKNLDRLLETFDSLKNKDLKLLLVGREDYFYKRLKQKVKDRGLEDNIVFTGFVPDDELSSLYQNAIALIIPSFMEGFGLPALEAMANNCLVVCSDIPSLAEVCGKNAFYFNPKNSEDMANKLEVVYNLTDNERKKYRTGGKANIQRFSWKKMAQETLALYESSVSLR